MADSESVIGKFNASTTWVTKLGNVDGDVWLQPMAEGKASIAEVMAHLTQWDRYLMTNAIPDVQCGAGIVFPEFDPFNAQAYAYARSGISQRELIEEFRTVRKELCRRLHALGGELLRKPSTANGEAFCPHTGTPYSLLYIVEEFTGHDRHHRDQIERFLQA